MQNNIGIYIPSKGRGTTAPFLKRLKKTEHPSHLKSFTIVVEPQDLELYRKTFPEFSYLVLDKNNQGIAYTRNFIKHHSIQNQEAGFWQIDDDIRQFNVHYFGTKASEKVTSNYLGVLQSSADVLLGLPRLAIGGLDYSKYALTANQRRIKFHLICSVDSVVFINNLYAHNLHYRKNTKEDRDIVLQALEAGYLTCRLTKFSFMHVANGGIKGGLHSEYKNGAELRWIQSMITQWPQYCSVVFKKKSGRIDVKINYEIFKQRFKTKALKCL
jgi:hypothetical protein